MSDKAIQPRPASNQVAELMEQTAVTEIVEAVRQLPIMKTEDVKFLQENAEHLTTVITKTQMWRTDTQKLSIINDITCPTAHAKFHQSILEQKVQFDQAMYLAKDFELKKIEVEELELDIEELGDTPRDELMRRKINIELKFKQYELKNMQTAMKYRMDEVKGWQAIEEELLKNMRDAGMDEEDIWTKGSGDAQSMFMAAMSNLQSLPTATDTAERTNLISAAHFTYTQAKKNGTLDKYKKLLTSSQLNSLEWLEKHIGVSN